MNRNPFAMMALLAATMAEAFRENRYRDMGLSLPVGRGRSRLPGKRNPAGSKFLRRAYKAKHGTRASAKEAAEWYSVYLAEKDRDARIREEKRSLERIARRFPWLAHRLPTAEEVVTDA